MTKRHLIFVPSEGNTGGSSPVEILLTSDNFAIEDSVPAGDIGWVYFTNFSISFNQPVDVKNKNLSIVVVQGDDLIQFHVTTYSYGKDGGLYFISAICVSPFAISAEDLIPAGAKLVIS